MKLTAITLDCADPMALSAFYRRATGWRPHERSDDEFAALVGEDGLVLGFQRVDDYRAATGGVSAPPAPEGVRARGDRPRRESGPVPTPGCATTPRPWSR